MKGFKLVGLLILALSCAAAPSHAADTAMPQTGQIRVLGRSSVTVTGETIKLEDVADVSSPSIAADESVIALKKIELGASPAPGQTISVRALSVLQRLKENNVDLTAIGYSLPQNISVTRAGRTITPDEIRAAIESYLTSQKRDITVKQIRSDESVDVLPGPVSIEAQELFGQQPGQLPFLITATVPGAQPVRFKAVAIADEWREVPVATRPLPRGSVISAGDVAMARLSTSAIPRDAAGAAGALVGLATTGNIAFGEVLQRSKLEIPPLVTAGSHVTMVVRTAMLEATASGTALESGAEGQEIKIRNDVSKKIVSGKITEAGLAVVTPVGMGEVK